MFIIFLDIFWSLCNIYLYLLALYIILLWFPTINLCRGNYALLRIAAQCWNKYFTGILPVFYSIDSSPYIGIIAFQSFMKVLKEILTILKEIVGN